MVTMPDRSAEHDLPMNALFAIATTTTDDEQRWSVIEHIRSLDPAMVSVSAHQLCQSADAQTRCVGVDVLAQLGLPAPTYHESVIERLLTMLDRETDVSVLQSIAFACGHRHDTRMIEALLRLHHHPDANVRHAAVFGLLTHTDARVVNALITLSADSDAGVRDWATFGLGTQIDVDTPALRKALLARLDDPEGDTAAEAMVGLARRKDMRVLPTVLALLESGSATSLPLEAAIELANPVLLPTLTQLRTTWKDANHWTYTLLEQAIQACTPNGE